VAWPPASRKRQPRSGIARIRPTGAGGGVFTQNRVQAAPVKLDRERVKSGTTRAVIVNAGNANCANGRQGMVAAEAMADAAARALNCPTIRCWWLPPVSSAPLSHPKGRGGHARPGWWPESKRDSRSGPAIMTTDTRPKTGAREGRLAALLSHRRRGQGRRYDPAGHGHHALLHLHGRRYLRCRPAVGAEAVGGRVFQPHHHRRRHQHQRHGDSHGQRRFRGAGS
jgi:hypothetical protein